LTPELLLGAVHSTDWPLWVVPFLAVGLWVFLCTLFAWMGGHMALLARFPPVDEALMERFHFASGNMRLVESALEGYISRLTLCTVRSCSGVCHAFRGPSSHAFALTPTVGEAGSGDPSSRSVL
jgi:hypothetical protein